MTEGTPVTLSSRYKTRGVRRQFSDRKQRPALLHGHRGRRLDGHDSPGATANYVADAERCRATLAPNPYLGAMLDDPYFPYGKAPH